MVVVIIVAILFQVLMPLKEVGDAVTGFLSIFTVDSDTFSNAAMTEEEINQIIADFSLYMDFYNMHFKAKLTEGKSAAASLKKHEENCHRQLSILLYGVSKENI